MRHVRCSLLAFAVGAIALAAVLSGCADGGEPVTLASTVPSSPPAGVEAAGSTDTGRGTPTGTKRAESILWFNDGAWWANMWDVISNDFHIFKLDPTTRTWKDDRVLADGRADTHADVLWNGTKLFIASHQFPRDNEPAVAGDPSLLFRYSYDRAAKKYRLDPGYPATINTTKSETLTIDQDSTGTLWATWQQGNTIYVNSTTSGTDQTQWGIPHPLPHARGVSVDDTSALVSYGGNRVGIMWSSQHGKAPDGMYFSSHEDGTPDDQWSAPTAALQGPRSSDDHINLKAEKAPGGHVYAAVKNSNVNLKLPLLELLVLDSATGRWTHHTIAKVSECPNRVTLLVDEKRKMLRTFATYPKPAGSTDAGTCTSSGGAIYEKSTRMDKIAFPPGRGTLRIIDPKSYVHNASSTKQNIDPSTGLVVLADNYASSKYWYYYEAAAR
jgi:hypothetical protein